MSTNVLGSPTLGAGVGGRSSRTGGALARDASPRGPAASGPIDEPARRRGGPGFARVVAATLAFYAALMALPFVMLVPLVMVGLSLGLIVTILGGSA